MAQAIDDVEKRLVTGYSGRVMVLIAFLALAPLLLVNAAVVAWALFRH